MGRGMWILLVLFSVLAVAMIYQESSGGIERPWAECKENLLTQIFSGECTPRSGGLTAPLQDGSPTEAPAPVDDGVTKVDRGQ